MIKDLTIILVTFKADLKILSNCIKPLKNSAPIIIVDNGSSLSLNELKKFTGQIKNITIIKSKNVGNGEGINIGVKNSKTKYVLYLDVDTEINHKTIYKLKNALNGLKDVAVIAPKIFNYKKENYIKKIFHSKNNIYEMEYIEGSIMLIDKSNTYDIGIKFDKNIFLYWEEIDFFHQCRNKQKKILLIKNLKAKHIGCSSTGKNRHFEIELNRNWHYLWSKFYYYKKNYSFFFAFFKTFRQLFSSLIKTIFYFKINKKKHLIYLNRFKGLMYAYFGKPSIRRPKIG